MIGRYDDDDDDGGDNCSDDDDCSDDEYQYEYGDDEENRQKVRSFTWNQLISALITEILYKVSELCFPCISLKWCLIIIIIKMIICTYCCMINEWMNEAVDELINRSMHVCMYV